MQRKKPSLADQGYLYEVQTLAISGKWVPKDGVFQLYRLAEAAVETFEAMLQGVASRIVLWQSGRVVCTVPGRAYGLHVR